MLKTIYLMEDETIFLCRININEKNKSILRKQKEYV